MPRRRLEVIALSACMAKMLYVVQVSLVATILGNRLALRGPAGSLNRAIEHMARALTRSVKGFVIGLQCFLASMCLHALRVVHPVASVTVVFILFVSWQQTHRHIKLITHAFHLEGGDVTIASCEGSACLGT